jgi:hypothetical protein
MLLLPLVAMQVTDQVNWNVADFLFAAALIGGTGVAYEVTVRMTANNAYRAGIGVALAAAFILIWINLAVGIIGREDDPANLMYGGVLALGLIGAAIVRFRARGMVLALAAMAIAQTFVAAVALITGLGYPASPPLELLLLNGFFAALWLTSAWLMRKAAREQASADGALWD